jgi:predicted DsbA family dithiol-disulfide isomerase
MAAQINIPQALHLNVISDTICPWCYVGKRHLEGALPILATEGLTYEIQWRPFQLNPDMPKEGRDRRAYRSAKFGSWEKSLALDAQVASAGAVDGLQFHHELIAKTPNTLASHILIRLAHGIGGATLQDRVVEALFAAYFTLGLDVGDDRVLADIGQAAGIDRAVTLTALHNPTNRVAVTEDEQMARRLGLNGVPSIVLDGQYLFSGAQPVSTIVTALREASARSESLRLHGSSSSEVSHDVIR